MRPVHVFDGFNMSSDSTTLNDSDSSGDKDHEESENNNSEALVDEDEREPTEESDGQRCVCDESSST